jgi:hypothetical protein
MTIAVDDVGHGKQRQVNARFSPMVRPFMFESDLCNPAAGWEKGQVEKSVGDARFRLWHDVERLMIVVRAEVIAEHECICSLDHLSPDLYTQYPFFILGG